MFDLLLIVFMKLISAHKIYDTHTPPHMLLWQPTLGTGESPLCVHEHTRQGLGQGRW